MNTPPTHPVISISPAQPVTTNDLVCKIDEPSYDADGDPTTYLYEWWVDGVTASVFIPTVFPSHTNTGENWECMVTPHDGTDYGPPAVTGVIIQ